ncbi:carbohydrate porin [Candidatus Avelusimicrobium luingense]|uniref:carbohydrate porin n=1 Tax=Candidatus Avelusimicrobium luingense TaxID=3416211 RepID=UPI003D12E65E
MNFKKYALTLLCVGAVSAAWAQLYVEEDEVVWLTPVKHEQRLNERRQTAKGPALDPMEKLVRAGKDELHKIGLEVGADISYLAQRAAPNGKQTAIQGVYYPYLTWNLFKDRALGSGQLNINYTLVRYWGTSAATLQNRVETAVPFNDYPANQEIFSQFSYTQTLPGVFDWMSITVGQFPLYNFDGTQYIANQQTALMNYALSQNATSVYPSASLGGYMQAQVGKWTLAAGYQDGTNLTGQNIELDEAFSGKYTLFGSVAWNPDFGFGQGQYSVLYYYQPSVTAQPEYVNGWSFNMQQNMGDKWAMFGRANGVDKSVTGVKNSYALGIAMLNPLNRNAADAIIAGVAYNDLSMKGLGYPVNARDNEMALELQWIWGIGNWITVTPDVQFYPKAGLNNARNEATIVSLRTTIML